MSNKKNMSKVPVEIDQYDTMKKRCFNYVLDLANGSKKTGKTFLFFTCSVNPKINFESSFLVQ